MPSCESVTPDRPGAEATLVPPGGVPFAQRGESTTRGAILLSAAHASVLVSNAAVRIAAGRALSVEWYGRLVIVLLVLTWARSVVGSVVLPGLEKAVSEDERRLRQGLGLALRWYAPAVLLATVALLLASRPLSAWLGDPLMVPLFWIAAFQVPFIGLVCAGQRLLSGMRRFMASASVKASYACLGAVATLAFLYLGFGARGAVFGVFVGVAAAGLLAAFLLGRENRRIPSVHYGPLARRVRYWTTVSVPTTLVFAALMTADMWLVKGMVDDPRAAGIYGVAYSLSRLPLFMLYGLAGAVFPRVSMEVAGGRAERAGAAATEALRFLLILFLPVCAVMAGSAREIAVFLFSSRYADSALPLLILAPGIALAALMHMGFQFVAASDRPGTRLAALVGLLACGLGLNWLLIPRWGTAGAAAASSATFALGAAVALLLGRRWVPFRMPPMTLLRCGLGGGLVFAVARLWPTDGPLLLVKLALLGLLYGGVVLASRETTVRELLGAARRVWR